LKNGEKTKEFGVLVNNRDSGLAELTEILGNNGVNIVTLSMSSDGSSQPHVRLITSDESTCRQLLKQMKYQFVEEEILTVTIEDKPGSLAKLLRKLKKSSIGVKSVYIINKKAGKVEFVVGVDNVEEGRKLLFEKLGLEH
jgi:hypothetical protein